MNKLSTQSFKYYLQMGAICPPNGVGLPGKIQILDVTTSATPTHKSVLITSSIWAIVQSLKAHSFNLSAKKYHFYLHKVTMKQNHQKQRDHFNNTTTPFFHFHKTSNLITAMQGSNATTYEINLIITNFPKLPITESIYNFKLKASSSASLPNTQIQNSRIPLCLPRRALLNQYQALYTPAIEIQTLSIIKIEIKLTLLKWNSIPEY